MQDLSVVERWAAMRTLIAMLAVSSGAAFLCVPPAHADQVVGGPRLAGHGYVWDRSSGVAAPPHVQASSYVIADLETGRILAAKDPHGHYRPASTLKTLTAITLIPRLDPEKTVKPSRAAVNASGSAVGLDTRWRYTVRDLFHGLLMQSGNDAAIALCEANGGLRPTLDQMNAEARRIQAYDTVARTPNGLDDDPPLTLKQQHSSAYDLALIMKQGLTLPDFRKYVGRVLYDWPAPPTKKQRAKGKKTGGWQIGTHDHLLVGDRYRGMIGGKNGWTSHALGSFVGAATRNGHTIIIALMHAQSDFWGDARALLNWGFAERAKAGPVGTLVDPVPPPRPRPVRSEQAAAGKPVAAPDGGLDWWKPAGAGAAGALLIAAVAGLVAGLRRRNRPAAPGVAPGTPPAGGPPSTGGEPSPSGGGHVRPVRLDRPPAPSGTDHGPAGDSGPGRPAGPRHRPPGDVKVAGAPLSGAAGGPAPAETAPNRVQPVPGRDPRPSDPAGATGDSGADQTVRDAEETMRDAEETVRDATRTVRDGGPAGRDSERTARDGEVTVRDGEGGATGAERTVADSERTVRDGGLPSAGGGRTPRDGEPSRPDAEQTVRDGELTARDAERTVRDGERGGEVPVAEKERRDHGTAGSDTED